MAISDTSAYLVDEGCLWLASCPKALAMQGCSTLDSAAVGTRQVGAFCGPGGAQWLSRLRAPHSETCSLL